MLNPHHTLLSCYQSFPLFPSHVWKALQSLPRKCCPLTKHWRVFSKPMLKKAAFEGFPVLAKPKGFLSSTIFLLNIHSLCWQAEKMPRPGINTTGRQMKFITLLSSDRRFDYQTLELSALLLPPETLPEHFNTTITHGLPDLQLVRPGCPHDLLWMLCKQLKASSAPDGDRQTESWLCKYGLLLSFSFCLCFAIQTWAVLDILSVSQ